MLDSSLLLILVPWGLCSLYGTDKERETTKAIHAIMNFVLVFILSASFIATATLPTTLKK